MSEQIFIIYFCDSKLGVSPAVIKEVCSCRECAINNEHSENRFLTASKY